MNFFYNYIDIQDLESRIAKNLFPFEKKLFWDTNVEKIDLEFHKNSIIERVICRGILEDFYVLNKVYSKPVIINALKMAKGLDPKTVNFCINYYGISKDEIHASSYYA